MHEAPTIVLAAGGTGGHMFPAEALARALLARGRTVTLVTDKRGQAFDSLPEVAVHRIHAASPGGGLIAKVKSGWLMGLGLLSASALMRHLEPAAVVGFGGYPSVPTVYAAAQARVPAMLHEQNAVLGRANRMLVAGARRLAIAFPDMEGLRERDHAKIVHTGNPVRAAVAARRAEPFVPPAADGRLNLLVMGGSQGARVFSEVLPAALARLPEALRARIHLAQQCRPEDLEGVRAATAGLGLGGVELESFFRDVPDRLTAAHLAIVRAGASTIAELTCVGRPALLVPYPFATDDHQTANARQVADAGAGWHLPQSSFTAETLALRLGTLLTDPDTLARAAAASHALGRDDAAERLADALMAMVSDAGTAKTATQPTEAAP